jgi:hypothetical protein
MFSCFIGFYLTQAFCGVTPVEYDTITNPSMTNPYRESRNKTLREKRERMRKMLGGRCRHCHRPDGLQFDCVEPRGHDHHEMNWAGRLRFYEKELAAGNLQLLCGRCHALKSTGDLAKRAFWNVSVTCEACGHHQRLALATILGPDSGVPLT